MFRAGGRRLPQAVRVVQLPLRLPRKLRLPLPDREEGEEVEEGTMLLQQHRRKVQSIY